MAIKPVSNQEGIVAPTDRIRPTEEIKSTRNQDLQLRSKEKIDNILLSEFTKDGNKITPKYIKKVVEEANERLSLANTKYQLYYNAEKDRMSIKVINRETNEVAREIPSDNALILLANIKEVTGLIIDKRI